MHFRFGILLLALVALALPSSSLAADRYAAPGVPVGGGDPESCLEVDPCNILDAIENPSVKSGDTIHVAAGDHTTAETLSLPAGANLVGAGADVTRVVPSADLGSFLLVLGGGSSAADVTLDAEGNALRAIQGNPPSATIHRVIASGGTHGCVLLNGTHEITDSVCVGGDHGIFISASSSSVSTMRNVTAIGGTYGLNAILISAATATTVDAVNLIAAGGTTDVYAETAPSAGAGSVVTVDLASSSFSTVLTEDGPGTEQITAPGTEGNQTAEPLFVDAEAGDYRQAPGSPTIDAGDGAATSLGEFDVFGQARILGAEIDIGAHEAADGDADGTIDTGDNCPATPNPSQADLDGDGVGDACDGDIDGDGAPNELDAFPEDPSEDTDSDGDGIGDNADLTPNGEPAASAGSSGGETIAAAPLPGPDPSPIPSCAGRPATIVGTANGERIDGTSGDDVIVALGGGDRIWGRGGDDVICAGSGGDVVRAGAGADLVLGQAGRDRLFGQAGADVLLGGAGPDRLLGQGGADRMSGGSGSPDECSGGAGRDRLVGGPRRSGCERTRL